MNEYTMRIRTCEGKREIGRAQPVQERRCVSLLSPQCPCSQAQTSPCCLASAELGCQAVSRPQR